MPAHRLLSLAAAGLLITTGLTAQDPRGPGHRGGPPPSDTQVAGPRAFDDDDDELLDSRLSSEELQALTESIRSQAKDLHQMKDKLLGEWTEAQKNGDTATRKQRREFFRAHRDEFVALRESRMELEKQIETLRSELGIPGPRGFGPEGRPATTRMPMEPTLPGGLADLGPALGELRQEVAEAMVARINAHEGDLSADDLRGIWLDVMDEHQPQFEKLRHHVFIQRHPMMGPQGHGPGTPEELTEYQEALEDLREQAWADREQLRESLRHALEIQDLKARQAEIERVRKEFKESQRARREELREARRRMHEEDKPGSNAGH